MVRMATAQSATSTSCRTAGFSPFASVNSTRTSAPIAAALVHAAMKPVIGVGAPWYTSGVHACSGAAPILNSSPLSTSSSPTTTRAVIDPSGETDGSASTRTTPCRRTVPEKP